MKDFLQACNTTSGRWNRMKFWLYPFGLSILLMVPTTLIMVFISEEIGALIMIPVYIYLTYVSVMAYIKRLRDLDKNPWMTLLLFVPLANLYLIIICAFFKGTDGQNKYGPDPLGGTSVAPEKKETVEL